MTVKRNSCMGYSATAVGTAVTVGNSGANGNWTSGDKWGDIAIAGNGYVKVTDQNTFYGIRAIEIFSNGGTDLARCRMIMAGTSVSVKWYENWVVLPSRVQTFFKFRDSAGSVICTLNTNASNVMNMGYPGSTHTLGQLTTGKWWFEAATVASATVGKFKINAYSGWDTTTPTFTFEVTGLNTGTNTFNAEWGFSSAASVGTTRLSFVHCDDTQYAMLGPEPKLGWHIWDGAAWNRHVPYVWIGGAWVPMPQEVGTDLSANQLMPSGNIGTDWIQTFANDFNTTSTAGNFRTDYPTMECYDGFVNETGNSYYSINQITVHNGAADMACVYNAGTGHRETGTILPNKYVSQTYGRVSFRMWVENVSYPVSSGYKVAFLWWPADNVEAGGEIDFPEGGFTAAWYEMHVHGKVNPYADVYAKTPANISLLTPHVVTLDWRPDGVFGYVDGIPFGNYKGADGIPTVPCIFRLQVEAGVALPDTASVANVRIDWVTMYTWGH